MPRSSTVSEKVWAQAIHAVTVQKMSLRRAAQLYGVHHMSLHRRVRGRYMTNQPSRFADDFQLTAAEESEALLVLREQLVHEGDVSADDVRYVVRTIASQDGQREIPSDFPLHRWISNFKRVHSLGSTSSPSPRAATFSGTPPTPPPPLPPLVSPSSSTARMSSSNGNATGKLPLTFAKVHMDGMIGNGDFGSASCHRTASLSSSHTSGSSPQSTPPSSSSSFSSSSSLYHNRQPSYNFYPQQQQQQQQQLSDTSNSNSTTAQDQLDSTSESDRESMEQEEDEQRTIPTTASSVDGKRCRQSKQVSPETWEKAMDAVEIHGMSLRTAAKAFGVHFAALHRRVKKRALQKEQSPPLENYIPFEDEAGIVRVIHARADLGILMEFGELADLLDRTATKYTVVTPELSRAIVRRFQSRVEQSIRHLIKDWPLPRFESLYQYNQQQQSTGSDDKLSSPMPPHLPALFPRTVGAPQQQQLHQQHASEPKHSSMYHQHHLHSPPPQMQMNMHAHARDLFAMAYYREEGKATPMEIERSPRMSIHQV